MQKLQETQERLFAEIKELISKISSFSNEEDFIAEVGVFTELQEKVISLKNYSEMLSVIRAEENVEQDAERQVINFEIDTKKVDDFSQPIVEIEEELEEEFAVHENAVSEKLDEEYFIEKEQNINELAENIEKEKEQEISEITLAKEEMEKKEEEESLHEERRNGKTLKLCRKTALDQALSRPAICLTAFMAKVRVRPMATPAIRQG